MIEIEEKDRDALRFLWVDDIETETPRVIPYRFARLRFGLKSSPALLVATIMKHLQRCDTYPDTISSLKKGMYVDDLHAGKDSIEEAKDSTLNQRRSSRRPA